MRRRGAARGDLRHRRCRWSLVVSALATACGVELCPPWRRPGSGLGFWLHGLGGRPCANGA
eukprot:3817229-Pyramimonas_sp.AAC.1